MINQNKQENKVINTNSNLANLAITDLSIFKDSPRLSFLYKKTEKLISAIYLVSSLLKDNEPLKEQIRNTSLCLLKDSFILSVRQNTSLKIEQIISLNTETFILNTLKILSFLDTAFYAGFISEMNFDILKSELNKVLNEVEREEGNFCQESVLSDQFFYVSEALGTDNTNNKFISKISDTNTYSNSKGHQMSDRNSAINHNNSVKDFDSHIRPSEQKQLVKSNRQDIIISMLKTKGNLGIKDFVSGIKDCSEKTIQRELTTLLDKGQISKTGEKRWSRYFIK
jgi:hypothetical protein